MPTHAAADAVVRRDRAQSTASESAAMTAGAAHCRHRVRTASAAERCPWRSQCPCATAEAAAASATARASIARIDSSLTTNASATSRSRASALLRQTRLNSAAPAAGGSTAGGTRAPAARHARPPARFAPVCAGGRTRTRRPGSAPCRAARTRGTRSARAQRAARAEAAAVTATEGRAAGGDREVAVREQTTVTDTDTGRSKVRRMAWSASDWKLSPRGVLPLEVGPKPTRSYWCAQS